MTNEQRALIATKLAGYEVQVSPAGKWYVVTGDKTKPLPDYESDSVETLSTAEAILRSRDLQLYIGRGFANYHAAMGEINAWKPTITAAIAHCLLQIAEAE